MGRLNVKVLLKRIKLSTANRLAIVVIALCSLVMISYMKGFLYSMWDHTLTPFIPELNIMKDYFVWDYSSVGGRYHVFLAHLPYHALVYVLTFIMPANIANTALIWLLFLSSGLSMYAFTLKTLKLNKNKKSYVALIVSLSYMFNPFWIFRLDQVFPVRFILAFLPLLMLVLREALMSADTSIKRIMKSTLLASLITVLMTPGFAEIPAGLATGFFIGIYLFFIAILRRKLKPFFITLTFFVVFFLLANLWWILPNLIHPTVQGALYNSPEYVSDSLSTLQGWSVYTTWFNVLRGMGYRLSSAYNIQKSSMSLWTLGVLKYTTGLFIIISILTPVVAVIGLSSRYIVKSSETLIFAFIAILFIPLFFTGLNPPFGFIVRWLLANTPFFVFRRPPTYMFLLNFMYAYMFGVGIYTLYYFARKQKFRLMKLSGYSMIACLLILVVGINAFPQWLGYTPRINLYDEDGSIHSVSALIREPDYVKDLVTFLNYAPERGGALILPMGGMLRAYNWEHGYFGWDIYYLSLNRPVLTHNNYGRVLIDDVYDMISNYVSINGSKFADLLTLLNIKFIIVAEDALRFPPTPVFNITKIHEFLLKNKDIILVKRFGKHVLYKNMRSPQMSYSVTKTIFPEPRFDLGNFTLNDYFNTKKEKGWEPNDAIDMKFSDSSLNVTCIYTEERMEKGFLLARTSNTIPFNLSVLDYKYLYVTLKTQPGVGLRIYVKDSTGVEFGLNPMNPNEESIRKEWGDCISTKDYYSFKFSLDPFTKFDYVQIALVIHDAQRIGNYTLAIKDMYFELDPNPALHLTGSQALLWLLGEKDPTRIAFVDAPKAVLWHKEIPTIIQDENNPTSFQVRAINATAPFLLISTINYDNGWIAELDGNQLEHIKVNGMFNGWIVNKTGSFDIQIYYRPQRYVQLYFYISGLFIAVTCITLTLQTFRPLMNKRVKTN